MRQIGVLSTGETLSDSLAADGFMVLNGMMDSWNADRLAIFTIGIDTFFLTPGQQTYTMGLGGNFNVPRPAKIERASIVQLNNTTQPLELAIEMVDYEGWQAIPVKNITSTLPTVVYDDGEYPYRNLSYWPIPTVAVQTKLYDWTALKSFPDLVSDITFPPGYQEAIRYNLAMRLIAEMPANFNQIMVSTTLQLATESLARIRSMNLPTLNAHVDPYLLDQHGYYNYYSDQPVTRRNW